jgi:hypothetical protein
MVAHVSSSFTSHTCSSHFSCSVWSSDTLPLTHLQGVHRFVYSTEGDRLYAVQRAEFYNALRPQVEQLKQLHPSRSLAAGAFMMWKQQFPNVPNSTDGQTVGAGRTILSPQLREQQKIGGTTVPTSTPQFGSHFCVVTYGDSSSFLAVENLIGSVHTWDHSVRIVVYDIGFTQEQIGWLQCVDNLEIRPFEFRDAPEHVGRIAQYAYRPLMLYDALQHADAALMLEPSMELRQSLRPIVQLMEQNGYFISGAKDAPRCA